MMASLDPCECEAVMDGFDSKTKLFAAYTTALL